MEATPWGLSPPPFKVLEPQPGEKSRICQPVKAFLWWAKFWRGRWRTCFIWVTSSFPSFQTENFSVRLCQERTLLLRLHVRFTLSLGRRKQRVALSTDQSRTKEWAQSPQLHPEKLLHGKLVQKSQLYFRTVAYFSQHALAAASWWGEDGGPPQFSLLSLH